MNAAHAHATESEEIRALARPLEAAGDLDDLVTLCAPARFVCLGEASHGTQEYYHWRAVLSRRLIEEHGFTWIGVEGDWPDCWRINQWLRGHAEQELDAAQVLAAFSRWPTWMWANEEVAHFLDWLHQWNSDRPEDRRTGFYGLDVYSLWDSLREIFSWLESNAPESVPAALQAWRCFVPFGEDPQRYASATRLVPRSCEADVVGLLAEVHRQTLGRVEQDPLAFDVMQNAIVASNAEHYYRTMVRGDEQSWNIRDYHMSDTIDRLSRHHGAGSKGIIRAHNTHIGDARATDMAAGGMVNIGQLMRRRHHGSVALVGFASYSGSVTAAHSWGAPGQTMDVPNAIQGSHEDLLLSALNGPSALVYGAGRAGRWLSTWRGHRAIGVVYNPARERGNYVPTVMGQRYDGLVWLPTTTALRPLHREYLPDEPELETEPTGF
ncbi:erythromycin esterase family protein [Paenarthrobacter ureafaciens]|uniref:erythromycin esterase family protein n=3 Tax=Paenarthrobacter TaxID=1742992 RepID=UPI001FB27765|nr:erythromycin esterase family protein [Paenarthrobacter ureafaciens]UOD82957.1 erythromycin esterase family protein [Paenarthrobacter ureafaciens]WNZ02664.1 erythromycin esterase family protein [Paenarthrobacter ureafaciens]